MTTNEPTNSIFYDPDYMNEWFERDAALLAAPTPKPAESRGKARQRLMKVAMAGLKRGEDQEDMIRLIMDDASAERLEPAEDDRYYWARGIVNFCESALGMRDRH